LGDDFGCEIRSAAPMSTAVARPRTRQEYRDIRDAVVVLPALFAVADIDADAHLAWSRKAEGQATNETKVGRQHLMFIIGHRRHEIFSLPDLVPSFHHLSLPIQARGLRLVRVQNRSCHGLSLLLSSPPPPSAPSSRPFRAVRATAPASCAGFP